MKNSPTVLPSRWIVDSCLSYPIQVNGRQRSLPPEVLPLQGSRCSKWSGGLQKPRQWPGNQGGLPSVLGGHGLFSECRRAVERVPSHHRDRTGYWETSYFTSRHTPSVLLWTCFGNCSLAHNSPPPQLCSGLQMEGRSRKEKRIGVDVCIYKHFCICTPKKAFSHRNHKSMSFKFLWL